jgi:hypothetical protein
MVGNEPCNILFMSAMKHDKVLGRIYLSWKEVEMKPLTKLCILMLVMGCFQGVLPGLAMEGEQMSQTPQVRQELRTNSPTSTARYVNVEGTLQAIQGDLFIIEGASAEQQIKIQVGKDTAFPNGQKELGQPVNALVSAPDGHALIIR